MVDELMQSFKSTIYLHLLLFSFLNRKKENAKFLQSGFTIQMAGIL